MKRSIKIVTAAVLTAGIAVGAAAYGKHEFEKSDRRAAYMASYVSDELDLDATQEQALIALKDEVLLARKLIHEQMMPAKGEIVELLTADSFDQARALELIHTKTTALIQAAPPVIAALGSFLDGLDAEQKAEIQSFKEHRGGDHGSLHDHD